MKAKCKASARHHCSRRSGKESVQCNTHGNILVSPLHQLHLLKFCIYVDSLLNIHIHYILTFNSDNDMHTLSSRARPTSALHLQQKSMCYVSIRYQESDYQPRIKILIRISDPLFSATSILEIRTMFTRMTKKNLVVL